MMSVAISNLATTWTNSGTTYTGIKLNVQDTASAAASLLMDLQVGAASQFNVSKSGIVRFTGSSIGSSAADLQLVAGSVGCATISSTTVRYRSPMGIGWSPTTNTGTAPDVVLYRDDAAGVLAQRNGTNAQVFRVYNTFTDASNYERGFVRYASNVLEIGHEAAGTGSSNRSIRFITQGFTALTISGASATFGVNTVMTNASIVGITNISSMAGYIEAIEMTAPAAPSADRVRIYAEDNGAGKTRLMALFATGAAVQIAIEP